MNPELVRHFTAYGAIYTVLGGLIVIAQLFLLLAQQRRHMVYMQFMEAREEERRTMEMQQLELERQRDIEWQKEREREATELAKVREARQLMSEANDLLQRIKRQQLA